MKDNKTDEPNKVLNKTNLRKQQLEQNSDYLRLNNITKKIDTCDISLVVLELEMKRANS